MHTNETLHQTYASYEHKHLHSTWGWLTEQISVNQKDHPPLLEDEVWRLKKIGKNGPLHKKLAQAKIKTVQDFLSSLSMDPDKLRKVRKLSYYSFLVQF